jgi:hypothetical protein
VNGDIASENIYSLSDRRSRDRLTIPDQSAPELTFRLSRKGALIVITAVSLGLWAAIAAAITSLASLLAP